MEVDLFRSALFMKGSHGRHQGAAAGISLARILPRQLHVGPPQDFHALDPQALHRGGRGRHY